MTRSLAIAVLAIAFTRSAAAQLLSPGPLSQAHAAIDGDDNCGKCHQSGKQVVAQLCLGCHGDLAARMSANAGLHGRNYKSKPCESCHVEHISRKSKLVRWPGGSMDKLDHALTGWQLEGDHRTTKCLACHTKTSPLGKPQFLGTPSACVGCHKDPHAGRFGTTCQSCHDTANWPTFDQTKFDHDLTRYPLTGKHDTVGCEGCHGTPAKWTGIAFAKCDDCHKDPHRGEFKPKPCTGCHVATGWAAAASKMRDNHPRLSLRNGHRKVKCATCHDRGTTKPPSKGGACVDCHKPVHEAAFGKACKTCHETIKWLGIPDAIGRDNHAKTPFPLRGKHDSVACSGCHPKSKPPAQRFRKLEFDRCTGCHADEHAGEFVARQRGECAQCHTVAGFAPTTFGLDDHATTQFALDGRHVAVACSGCHTKPRPRLDFRIAKRACAECHDNPHGDQFAKEMALGGCAQCHAPADWHLPRIDHSMWPLTGVHGRTACAGCHGRTKPNAEPASYRGVPRECEGCHDDIHAGQFRIAAPIMRCTDCHDTKAFEIPAFDHVARAGYPLEGKHAAVACAACHPAIELRDGSKAVRYRLGYRKCKDCHADPHREPQR